MEQDVIRRRVAETAAYFGMEALFDADVSMLSGGQKQLLNLASVMAMQPDILILDEPTAQLDPIAAADFFSCLQRINKELGITVIISEHKTEELLPISDKVIVLDNGAVISFDTPLHTGYILRGYDEKLFRILPAAMRIWHKVDTACDCPVTIAQGREWLTQYAGSHQMNPLYPEVVSDYGKTIIELKNIRFRYHQKSKDVLNNLSFKVKQGECIAILGGNGAGKSTLLSVINGLLRPYCGKVIAQTERIATLPQNPQLLLNGNTVIASLKEMLPHGEHLLEDVIALCKLEDLLDRHPFDLSGGETQRAALAKILLSQPDILLLDEPTKGFDNVFKEHFAYIIQLLLKKGTTIIMVSHDVEFCAKYPHSCLMLFNGELIAKGTPRVFFSSNSFYVTSSRRISKGVLENAVTAEDIIYCCTGEKIETNPQKTKSDFHFSDCKTTKKALSKRTFPVKKCFSVFGVIALVFGLLINMELIAWKFPFFLKCIFIAVPALFLMIGLSDTSHRERKQTKKNARFSPRTIVASLMILLAIPVTIFIGTTYLDDQKFLFISLLVLLECMLPFFLIFEGRKRLVIIAAMCAITIAGRSAFAALPQVKPVVALIILSGVAFGAESGFIVGAVTMLVSNIYFGQGAWTPWQMFAAGIIGFLSGILFRKGLLRRNRGALSVFGFIVTIVVYGLIMNFSTIVLSRAPLTRESILAFYAQGLPFDVLHAISTLIILFFAAEPLLYKLDRIKTKYGLLD